MMNLGYTPRSYLLCIQGKSLGVLSFHPPFTVLKTCIPFNEEA